MASGLMTKDYKLPHWFQLCSFMDALNHLEQTAYLLQKTYEGVTSFGPVSTLIEILFTSTWCLNRPMMYTLDAMIFDISNVIIPNLRDEKSSLKTDYHEKNEKLDRCIKAHKEKESAEKSSRLRCEKFNNVPIVSYLSRKQFIHAIAKRLSSEKQLNVAKLESDDILEELSETERLIIDLNGLVKVMRSLYDKGMDACLMKDY